MNLARGCGVFSVVHQFLCYRNDWMLWAMRREQVDGSTHFGRAEINCFLLIGIRKMRLMWWTISQQENWVIKMILIEADHKINGCVYLASAVEQSCPPDAGRVTECHSRQRGASEGQMWETRDFASPGTFPGSFYLLTDVTVSSRGSWKWA